MSKSIGSPDDALMDTIRDLQARIAVLERASSGTHSIGSISFRPGVKAGTPSDADYPAAFLPPIGWLVTDTVGLKLWTRTATATWKGVGIA